MRRSATLYYALVLAALVVLFLLFAGIDFTGLPFTPDAEFSDAVTTHFSSALYLREWLAQPEQPVSLPLWRDTIMGGQPFAANPLNKTAYPFQWLAALFLPVQHLNLLILIHLALAGAGMWCWTRAQGMRREPAALSVIAYVMAPRMVGHLGAGHLDIVYALAWFPWLMEAVRRTAHNPTWYHVLITALTAAMLLIADVRVSLFAFLASAGYGWSLAHGRRRRALLWGAAVIIVGLALTAAVIVPLAAYSPHLSRAALTADEAGIFSLQPIHFLGLILPPQGGNIETLTYTGLPVLFLAIIAIVSAPRKFGLWIALLLFAVLWSLGVNSLVWNTLVRLFPSLLWFRVPSRAWLLAALILPLLAGFGLDMLCTRIAQLHAGQRWKGLRNARMLSLALLAACVVAGIFVIIWMPLGDTVGLSLLVWGGGFSLALLLAFSRRLPWRVFAWIMLLLTFGDLATNSRPWLEWRGEHEWLVPYQGLAQRLREDGAARVYSPTYSLPQQAAEAYGIPLFGGVDPFQIEQVSQAIMRGGGIEFEGYSVVMPPLLGMEGTDIRTANRNALPDTTELAAWDASHIIAAYPIEHERLRLVDIVPVSGHEVYIYRNLDYGGVESISEALALPVEHLNAITLASWHISLIALVVAVFALAIYGVRQIAFRRVAQS